MTYSDVLQNAKKTIKNCRVCPECNGLACGNLMPGPGSKAPGNGANVNWKAWQEIRLNMDTFVSHAPVDTSGKLFGREYSIPLIAGPIGSLLQYSDTDVTVPYNDGVMEAAAECGFLASFGDGLAGETLPGALASMEKHPAGVIPVLNPLPNETIIRNMAMFEQSSALALAVVVDSAGLFHWKGKDGGASSKTIEDLVSEATVAIGEKISVRRFVRYQTEGVVDAYIHLGGKVGVLVEVATDEKGKESDEVKQFAHDLALQIAAAKPDAVRREEVDPEKLNKEREIQRAKFLEEGKPEKIVDRIVDGQIEKYYKDVVLLDQQFVKDGDKTIKGLMAEVSKQTGAPLDIVRFARFERGEGIEKRKDDLAGEIAAMMK